MQIESKEQFDNYLSERIRFGKGWYTAEGFITLNGTNFNDEAQPDKPHDNLQEALYSAAVAMEIFRKTSITNNIQQY